MSSTCVVAIVPDSFWRSGMQGFLTDLGRCDDLTIWHSYQLTEPQWQELARSNLLLMDEPSPEFCVELRKRYADLPVLIISDRPMALKLSGLVGYCFRNNLSQELTIAIDTLLSGRSYGSAYIFSADQEQLIPVSPWQLIKHNLRVSALQRIDHALAHLTNNLTNNLTSNLSSWQKWIVDGKARELRAARWLLSEVIYRLPALTPTQQVMELVKTPTPEMPVPVATQANIEQALALTIVTKIQQFSLNNLTQIAQEIDILRPQKRKDLLLAILQSTENLLQELKSANLSTPELQIQISNHQKQMLIDVWKTSTTNFIGKYFRIEDVVVVDTLLKEAGELYLEVPQFCELILHLLKAEPLAVENSKWVIGSPTAMGQAELLWENLILTIANAVIQPLLNNFAHAEVLKQQFYSNQLLATRDIEKFRNDLSWKYRRLQYIDNPRAIFESRQRLLCLTEMGIRYRDTYADRTQELQQLQGIPYLFTLLLELQDAIAPRLKAFASWLGSGLVYVLTNIIGKGIGLIGRGVLQGIGSAFRG